jgi:hypothetical protein
MTEIQNNVSFSISFPVIPEVAKRLSGIQKKQKTSGYRIAASPCPV